VLIILSIPVAKTACPGAVWGILRQQRTCSFPVMLHYPGTVPVCDRCAAFLGARVTRWGPRLPCRRLQHRPRTRTRIRLPRQALQQRSSSVKPGEPLGSTQMEPPNTSAVRKRLLDEPNSIDSQTRAKLTLRCERPSPIHPRTHHILLRT
jgi:hypothetical protein